MSKKITRIIPLVILFLLMLAACSPKPAVEETPETEAAAIAVTESQTVQQEPAQPDQEADQEPTSAPQEVTVPTAEPPQMDEACIDCHSDKEKLIDTAKEEEVVEIENEGEG